MKSLSAFDRPNTAFFEMTIFSQTYPPANQEHTFPSGIADTFHWLIRRGQTSGEISDDLDPARLTIAFHRLYLGAMLRWLADPRLKLCNEFAAAVELFLHVAAASAKASRKTSLN